VEEWREGRGQSGIEGAKRTEGRGRDAEGSEGGNHSFRDRERGGASQRRVVVQAQVEAACR